MRFSLPITVNGFLPSSAGRTTMCPTELMYDETFPPCIRLLPIETRSETLSTTEYKKPQSCVDCLATRPEVGRWHAEPSSKLA